MLKKKKKKFPTIVFITAALTTFFVLSILVILLSAPKQRARPLAKKPNNSRYYLNENFKDNDPFITRNPNLKDILTGPIISGLDPARGNASAPVSIIIFSDYVCSFCAEQEKVVSSIAAEYGDTVSFIWKDYPESDTSSLSWQAAVAARCAGQQGAYWQYHDSLFETENLNAESFLKIAQALGLNINAFNLCQSSEDPAQKIIDNMLEAEALGIRGIPFLFVNDWEFFGEVTHDELKKIVELELQKNK